MPKRKATETKAATSEEKEEQKETQPQTKKTKITKKDGEESAKKSVEPSPRRSTRSQTKVAEEKPSTPQKKKSKAKGDDEEEEPKKGTPKKSKAKEDEEEPKKGTPKKSKGKSDEEDEAKGTPKKSKGKGDEMEEEKDEAKDKKDEGKKSVDSKKSTPSKGKKSDDKEKQTTPKKKKGKEDEEEDDEKEEPKKGTPKKSKGKSDEEDEPKGTPKKSKGKGDEEEGSKKGTPKKSKGKGDEMEEEKEVDTKTKQVGTESSTKETKVSGRKLNREGGSMEETEAEESSRPLELGDGKIPGDTVLIASWNVNGLNALTGKKKDLHNYMKDKKPDILCLSETKLNDDGIDKIPTDWVPEGYSSYWSCCRVKKGYAGTAIISKYKPISVKYGIGVKKHDQEGRTITAEFENFYLMACYIPNAGEKLAELKYRVDDWDPAFKSYVNDLKKKKHVIVCGDLNCAYEEIDIHKAKGSEKLAGFTPQERKSFGELLGTGFVDTFRHLHPEEQKFSYFSARFNNRETNKGWRLDYFLVDKEGLGAVKESGINEKIYGSDHLPIELVLNPAFK